MKKKKHISQSGLESYLWGAAALLRGYIDAGDYKQFIFPLLFYERICDVYDEELAEALEKSGGDHEYAQLPEQHRFQIPEDAHCLLTSAIGRTNLFLHGIEDFKIVRGDTLAHPAFVEGDRPMQFDVVLANPPYSIKQWDRDVWAVDPWGRNIYGTPPQGRADYAFRQHIIKSMKPKTGRCAILFPHGVLFRNEESAMREKLVAHDAVECVLGLGPNLLTDDNIQRIVAAYQAFGDEEGFAQVVRNDEIRQKGSNLSIPLYIRADNGNGNGNGATRYLRKQCMREKYPVRCASLS